MATRRRASPICREPIDELTQVRQGEPRLRRTALLVTRLNDDDEHVVEESGLATTAVALRRRFGSERRRIIPEAGLHSPWISRLLPELGYEVYVANPSRLRAIYVNENNGEIIHQGIHQGLTNREVKDNPARSAYD